jgi:hypothetical protein
MSRTGGQIENDIYDFLCGSALAGEISGNVYHDEMRPKDSNLEDITVKFIDGGDGQIQTGKVAVNLFVPDIDVYGDGILRKHKGRCDELEAEANEWVEQIRRGGSDYWFEKSMTIKTMKHYDIPQHFISIMLSYRVPDF